MAMSGYGIQSKRYLTRLEAARDPVTGRFTQGGGHPGRKVGSRNKHRRLSAQERLLEYEARAQVSTDPVEGLARIALDDQYDARTRLSAWKALARYIYPQRKAVDFSADDQEAEAGHLSDAELESIVQNENRFIEP